MSDFLTPEQVAQRLSEPGEKPVSAAKVREIVRDECAAMVPDELRFVPGGRVHDNVMRIWTGIFESVISGRAVTRTAPTTQPLSMLHTRKVV
jgi:hypothetical protein